MKLKITTKDIKSISVGGCWFCEWKPTEDSTAKFQVEDGAVYVFCPKCGYEIQDAQFLIGENVDK